MWKRYSEWNRQQRQDYLNVLQDPNYINQIESPQRRRFVGKLNELSRIERMQLYQFMLIFDGATKWRILAVVELIFVIAAIVLYSVKPKGGLVAPLVLTHLLGWSFVATLIGIWFNYRSLMKKRLPELFGLIFGLFVGMSCAFLIAATFFRKKSLLDAFREDFPGVFFIFLGLIAVYVLMIGIVAAWRNKTYETINVQLELEAEREKNARQSSETQLRLLRAQIEPHFLFNTLGAVQQLAEDGAPKAAQLTANLIVFLRASISEMRSEQILLRDEFAMIRAYLEVMQVRIGPRLQFQIDLPEDLAGQLIPSMMLLTLAENAIKHGIEPALRGGEIRVTARVEGDCLQVCVNDSGVGLKDQSSGGIGLQNVRDRLRLAYGSAAAFILFEREEGGVMAQVRLPLTTEVKTFHLTDSSSVS